MGTELLGMEIITLRYTEMGDDLPALKAPN